MNVVRRFARAPLRARRFPLIVAMCVLPACGSTGGCGGCDGFEVRDFPSNHYDKMVPQSTQIHLTPTGAQFIEQNAGPLIGQATGGALNVCLPKDTSGDPKLCFPDRNGNQPICDDGSEGCQINLKLEQVRLKMVADPGEPAIPDDTMVLEATISDLNPTIPFETNVAVLGNIKCDIIIHKQGEPETVPGSAKAKVPIRFVVNQASPTKDTQIELGDLEMDLDQLGIRPRGSSWKCTAIEVIEPLVRPILEDQILKPQLNDMIQGLVNENLCRSCADDASSCPAGSTCDDVDGAQICRYSNNQECVPALLGVEGRLDLGNFLADFTQTPDAKMDLSLRLGDFARANEKGLTLAMRSGFQPTNYAQCVPVDPTPAGRPSFEKIPITNTLRANVKPGTSDPFMLGVGIHKRLIEHALWSAWGGGALCLAVDSKLSELLATSTFGLFLPSLKTLADKEKRALSIQITPQKPPAIVLGENQVSMANDGTLSIVDGLMTLDWKDVDIHLYGFVHERYARLFTLRVDLVLPLAMVPGDNKLKIVPGDLDNAIQNVRPMNIELMEENADKIASIVPQLVGVALPMLAGSLEQEIDLPDLFGYQIDLQQGDITSIDELNGEKQMIALFANLKPAPMMMQPLTLRGETVIHKSRTLVPKVKAGQLAQPTIELEVSGLVKGQEFSASDRRFEYSWRLNRGPWSGYTSDTTLSITRPVLALPGEHTVEVRARLQGQEGTEDPTPATTKVTIDTMPPELEIERRGALVTLRGHDTITEALEYRWRTHDGASASAWTAWSKTSTIDLDEAKLPTAFRLEAEVRDAAGLIARDTQTIRYTPPVQLQPTTQPTTTAPAEHGMSCATADPTGTGNGAAPVGGLGLAGLLGLAVAGRRRRKLGKGLLGLLVLLGLATGCGKDETGNKKTCSPACEDGYTCKDGACEPPPCDQTECEASCASSQVGMCNEQGQCVCRDACADGCADGTFCCYEKDACEPIPDPCAGKMCDPGFEPKVSSEGTPNSETCAVDNAVCDCVALPPLPMGEHGRHLDVASNGATTMVSAYNQQYGDLMVGTLDANLTPTWSFIDGVPTDGDIEGAIDGPRGGVKDRGDNVGTHTAIVVDEGGTAHVFYRDEENDTLKYARGTGDKFEITTLDDEGDTGYFTDAIWHDGKVHVVYQAQTVKAGDAHVSQLRYLAFEPSTTVADVAALTPEVATQGRAKDPCAGTCARGELCAIEAGQCFEESMDCADGCADGLKCMMGACVEFNDSRGIVEMPVSVGLYPELSATPTGDLLLVYYDHTQKQVGWTTRDASAWGMPRYLGTPSGPYASGAVDGNGVLHLAYMVPSKYQLVYEQVDQGVTEVIDDGLRDTPNEWLLTRTGDDVTLLLGDDGKVRAAYHDSTLHQLKVASRMGPNQWAVGKLSEPGSPSTGAHGYYAAIADGAPIAFEYVIHASADEPTAYPAFLQLP